MQSGGAHGVSVSLERPTGEDEIEEDLHLKVDAHELENVDIACTQVVPPEILDFDADAETLEVLDDIPDEPYSPTQGKSCNSPSGLAKRARKTVGTAKYHAPRTSPNARKMDYLAKSFGCGFRMEEVSVMRRSASDSALRGYDYDGRSSPTSRPGTGLPRPTSHAGGPVRPLVDTKALPESTRRLLRVHEMSHAGVSQDAINPNVPFSGFPNLTYLRGF